MVSEEQKKNSKSKKKKNSSQKNAAKNSANNNKNKQNNANKSNKSNKNNSKKKNKKYQHTKPKEKKNENTNLKQRKTNEDKPQEKPKHGPKEEDQKTNKEKREEKLKKLRKDKERNKKIKIGMACAAAVYVLGVVLFSFVGYPNTVVADTNISFRTPEDMKDALIPNSGEYVFTADGFDFDLEIDGKLIDYNFNVDEVVDRVLSYKNPLAWPVEIFIVHDFMSESVVSFNREAAASYAAPAIEAHNKTAAPSRNADFICDSTTKTVDIKEEFIGNSLKPDETLNSILGYIGSGRRHLSLGDNEHLIPTLYADDERIPDAIEKANILIKSVMTLQMSTTPVATIDYALLSTWVHLRDGYVAGLNDEILVAWIAGLADQCDTLGKSRTYVAPYGKTCTVSGGDDIGWQIDQLALFNMISAQAPKGETVSLSVPCSSSLNGYGGPGGKDWGARYIDVDLGQQHARMYGEDGSLIWEADIISGKPSTPTYTGIFTVKMKASPSTLIGSPDPATGQPSYRTTVQYWMGFEGNAIGFHDATWQSGFGGNRYLTVGSHGCVNLSYSSAQSLYGLCVSGDIVVVHN